METWYHQYIEVILECWTASKVQMLQDPTRPLPSSLPLRIVLVVPLVVSSSAQILSIFKSLAASTSLSESLRLFSGDL